MKALFFFSLLTLTTTFAGEGTPPEPSGTNPRFSVVAGSIVIEGKTTPVFIRIDNWTGQTWTQLPLPMNGAGSQVVRFWLADHEVDSDLYKLMLDSLRKR